LVSHPRFVELQERLTFPLRQAAEANHRRDRRSSSRW
jgi:hypothetical protein